MENEKVKRKKYTKKTIKEIMKHEEGGYRQASYERCIDEIIKILTKENNIFLNDFLRIKIKKVKPRTIYSNLPKYKKTFKLNKTEKMYIYPTKEFEKLILEARKNLN